MGQSVADSGGNAEPRPLSTPRKEEEGDLTESAPAHSVESPLQWEKVRIDFEGDEKTSWAICREYGIHPAVLARHAKKAKWNTAHRDAGLDRTMLIKMLFGVLDLQINQLENPEMTETSDKAAAALGRLVTTLERLIEVENRAGPASTPAQTKEMQEIRRKLARRIDRLAKR